MRGIENDFIMFFLLHYGLLIVAMKYNLRSVIRNAGEKTKLRLLYEMSECEFCTGHAVGVLLLTPFLAVKGFEFVYLIYPFMAVSLIFLIKRKL